MLVCPKCGYKTKHGSFCEKCGAHLAQKGTVKSTKGGFPSIPALLALGVGGGILALIVIVIFILVGLVLLSFGGFFQSSTTLSASIKQPVSGCIGAVDYSVELTGSNSEALVQQEISTYVDGVLLEKLKTDSNGRLSSTKPIPKEWCGKNISFTFVYEGDFLHKSANQVSIIPIKIPTKLLLMAPNEAVEDTNIPVNVSLVSLVDNSPVLNKKVIISNGFSTETITNPQGIGTALVEFNETGLKTIKANFNGDGIYLASSTDLKVINVMPQTCSDGTIVDECSTKTPGHYCLKIIDNVSERASLIPDCKKCACAAGLVCYKNACITEEQRTAALIEELQDNVVYVEHSYATGSGIVFYQSPGGGETVILTNRHVVEGADSISDVKITTYDQKTAFAENILIAPEGMDLAVVFVSGKYGVPAKINYSESYSKGQEVVALGSPLGLQGSVSDGIISNFVYDITTTGYTYDVIQTDAAINPGNSGGGLFLKSSGILVGINTFGLPSEYGQEGLGFAIDIKELQQLPAYPVWQKFSPTPRCYDGTPYGSCSYYDIGFYCSSSGSLYENCNVCGCPNNYPYCPSGGKCFSCPAGYSPFEDDNGEGVCCPGGWTLWGNGESFCCPPGTIGYEGGYCA
jgi:hypothetical protein